MNELSLFSGIGGGCLASQHLLKHRLIGYVEKNEYCQKVIRSRIEDGLLDNAPIYGDIQTFIDTGCCEVYRGVTDIINAGFPCQPFSVAGKRLGADDERNMWPATCEIIERVKPQYAFLENVCGLTYSGYLGRILQDLAEIGYDARWTHLSASDCGAPHKRERLWIMAYPQSKHDRQCDTGTSERQTQQFRKRGCEGSISDSDKFDGYYAGYGATEERLEKQKKIFGNKWWAVESGLDRVVDGFPGRLERIRTLGNAQVPIVAATAFRILIGEIET